MNLSPSGDEKPSENRFVLDSSALLALALREIEGEEVRAALAAGAIMSAVNLAEVLARLLEEGGTIEECLNTVITLNPTVVDFSAAQAVGTAGLRQATKHLGLGLGDRACLALARELRLPLLTADRKQSMAEVGVESRLVR